MLTPFGLRLCAVMLLLVACKKEPPPEAPDLAPPPPPPERTVNQVLRYTEPFYRSVLDEDTQRYGVPPITPAELGAPLPTMIEWNTPRSLEPGDTITTKHLRISAAVDKRWTGNGPGSGIRTEHLLVSITNLSDKPIAYRVDTELTPRERGHGVAQIVHNAVALAAGETAERAEGLAGRGAKLQLVRVEVIELPTLSYYYLSRLDPTQIGLDARTSSGHRPPAGRTCSYIPWRDIQTSGASWRDVIDFYARHNCDEYFFFPSYRFHLGAVKLPARDPRSANAAPN